MKSPFTSNMVIPSGINNLKYIQVKTILTILIISFLWIQQGEAQDTRRERRNLRDKEKAEEISKMVGRQDLRFIAQFALPMAGNSVHLTSEYTLDIAGDSITAWLPFFGRAYTADYGSQDGGIKFSERATATEWKLEKRGTRVNMEVKAPKDVYRLSLQITPLGFASLDVYSNNRQAIRFSGIVVKRKE